MVAYAVFEAVWSHAVRHIVPRQPVSGPNACATAYRPFSYILSVVLPADARVMQATQF